VSKPGKRDFICCKIYYEEEEGAGKDVEGSFLQDEKRFTGVAEYIVRRGELDKKRLSTILNLLIK
jgi:hypothetical protein